MGLTKKEIIDALNTNIKELQQGIEAHSCLVASILEEQIDERSLISILDRCPKRTRELKLEKAVKEAIDVIEESRKAFKSKRLEALRKKLTSVLMDVD